MIGVSKVMIIFGIVLTTILYWASSNVCRYNFAIDKKSNILSVITKEIEIVGEIQKTLLSQNKKENFPIAGINIPAKVV